MGKEKDIWNKRYQDGGNSGASSYGVQLGKKLDLMVRNIPSEEIKTITEIGCGDFNFGKFTTTIYPAKYIGLDISDYIVYKNKYFNPDQEFYVFDGKTIQPADMILLVDVLFHILDDNEVEELLRAIEKIPYKYFVVTAYERAEPMYNHVRIRKFDYKRFGIPLVREVIEEEGQMYFYIFKKDGPEKN